MPLPPNVPELAALDLLRSVVHLGSMSRAAELHRITQPSASSRIRSLERQLGVRVLDRSPTGSQPTPDGQLIAGWADEVLGAAERLATGVESLRAHRTGLLRIAASYTIAEYLLPPWLDRFLDDRPDDSVVVDVTNSRAVLDRLDAGKVDLGFVESPTVPPTIREQLVGTDELIVVVAPRHRWARVDSIDLATLASTPLVLREVGSGTRDALDQELARLGVPAPSSVLDLGSISAVRVAVINGSSPTVISRLAVAEDLERGTLVEVPVDGLRIDRQLRAVWSKKVEPSRLAVDLLEHLAP
ncbi:LysR family transcriptional regulator [Ilumatobacter nonamiensis]|uniref:LysR family transcriptional regulator n=1 Tax=Ilumatobacter nonamiensis TaxID=467093 RepID=UPI00058EC557|nr:LysR family transcriptional regulator [Ilumatobacter nonamiensis]